MKMNKWVYLIMAAVYAALAIATEGSNAFISNAALTAFFVVCAVFTAMVCTTDD